MAKKRMFSIEVVASDSFLDMPLSTRALYFHLGMYADDDGFVNNPQMVKRLAGASDDDLKLLVAKGFIIPFASGVTVIKHWRINNYLQADRYKPTAYIDEYAQLEVKKNEAYTLKAEALPAISAPVEAVVITEQSAVDLGVDTKCIQNVSKMDTQIRLDEIRLDELRTQQQQQYIDILSNFKDNSISEIAKLPREEKIIIEDVAKQILDVYFGRAPRKVDTGRIYGYMRTLWSYKYYPEKAPAFVLLGTDEDYGDGYEDKVKDVLEMLKHAFDMSSRAEKPSYEYVETVLVSYRCRGIKSVDDLWEWEVARDAAKGKV